MTLVNRDPRSGARTELAAAAAPVAAPVWVVYAHDSQERHAAYRSAYRTLCGIVVQRGLRGRGQEGRPTCPTCAAALDRHRLGGFVGATAACLATTTKGTRCRRPPFEGGRYCFTHRGHA